MHKILEHWKGSLTLARLSRVGQRANFCASKDKFNEILKFISLLSLYFIADGS